jgi:hypothetical protein
MDSRQAEELVEAQALSFEEHKDYLLHLWDERVRHEETNGIEDHGAPLYL